MREHETFSSDSFEGLKPLLDENLAAKSDEDVASLQRVINVAISRLLSALSGPFTEEAEKFLREMQRVTASSPIPMSECSRNRFFYFGQIYAMAELAGTVRHMQVPLEAARVALSHSDAEPILRLVVERDAITKAGLAKELGKVSQNLHSVLQKLEECGLIRRDEIGRSVVYSPTPFTRVCLNWMQETEAATTRKEEIASATKPLPEGFQSVTPGFVVRNAAKAIDFYKRALGARELVRMPSPDGKIIHAELKLGNSIIFLSDEMPQSSSPKSPETLGGVTGTIQLYVPNVDQVFQQAIAAGAKEIVPVADQFWGDRWGSFVDPFGQSWGIGTHKEDLTPGEVQERMQQFFISARKEKTA